jgi:general secretion pathway protein E
MTAPLERTVNPQQLDPHTVRLLPYPFAKAKGVIAARDVAGTLEVWIRPYPQASTLAEVRRMAGKPIREVLLTPEEFEHCLALAYTREPSTAENIVEDMGDSVDLAKLTEQLPEVADLGIMGFAWRDDRSSVLYDLLPLTSAPQWPEPPKRLLFLATKHAVAASL